jgi:hypothetical protein
VSDLDVINYGKSLLAPHSVERDSRGASSKEASLSLSKAMVHKVCDNGEIQYVPSHVQARFNVEYLQVLQLCTCSLLILTLTPRVLHGGSL